MAKKNALRLALEGIPCSDFLESLWLFIRNPEIEGKNLENSSLHFAGKNFITSLFLVSIVVVFFQLLFPGLYEADFGQLVNPLYLSIILALQAIVFAFIVTIVSSIFLLFKKPAFHYFIAYQVIQVYAVLNLLVVVLFWIAMNRILTTGNAEIASNPLDLWLGGGIAIFALYLNWRLLIRPLWNYIAKYYTKNIALVVTTIVLSVSLWVNSYTTFGLNELVINKSAFCKELYEVKKQKGEIGDTVDKECFIGHCISYKNNEP